MDTAVLEFSTGLRHFAKLLSYVANGVAVSLSRGFCFDLHGSVVVLISLMFFRAAVNGFCRHSWVLGTWNGSLVLFSFFLRCFNVVIFWNGAVMNLGWPLDDWLGLSHKM
ncbi:hypothetical protein U1Q18_032613 [Sarracenia purpurea var. burkii]